jgi:hypothetical protein
LIKRLDNDTKTIKENKMKTKCIMVLVALVIALGAVTTITGCKKSEPPAEPPASQPDVNTTE